MITKPLNIVFYFISFSEVYYKCRGLSSFLSLGYFIVRLYLEFLSLKWLFGYNRIRVWIINIPVYFYTIIGKVVMLWLTTTDIPNITITVWNTAVDICDQMMLVACSSFVVILGGGPLPIITHYVFFFFSRIMQWICCWLSQILKYNCHIKGKAKYIYFFFPPNVVKIMGWKEGENLMYSHGLMLTHTMTVWVLAQVCA